MTLSPEPFTDPTYLTARERLMWDGLAEGLDVRDAARRVFPQMKFAHRAHAADKLLRHMESRRLITQTWDDNGVARWTAAPIGKWTLSKSQARARGRVGAQSDRDGRRSGR